MCCYRDRNRKLLFGPEDMSASIVELWSLFGALLGDVHIFEDEIGEFVLIGLQFNLLIDVAVDGAVAQSDVVAIGHGDVLAVLQVVELCPGTYVEHARNLSGDVLDGDILVALRSIGAHLEPKQTRYMIDLDTTQDDVVIEHRFRTTSQATVTETVGTIFNDNIAV